MRKLTMLLIILSSFITLQLAPAAAAAKPTYIVGYNWFSGVAGSSEVAMTIHPDGSGKAKLFEYPIAWQDVAIVSADGTRITLVIPNGVEVCGLPGLTGCKIVYQETDPSLMIGIWSALPSNPDMIALYVTHVAGNVAVNNDVYKLDLASKLETPLTKCAPYNCTMPAWSPDGKQLVYTGPGNAPLTSDLYIMGAGDGTVVKHLTTNTTAGEADIDPDWSPVGNKVLYFHQVFYQDNQGTWQLRTWQLRVINTDGTGSKSLLESTVPLASMYQSAAWSPDGQMIAYIMPIKVLPGDTYSKGDLYVMKADGTGKKALVKGGAGVRPFWITQK